MWCFLLRYKYHMMGFLSPYKPILYLEIWQVFSSLFHLFCNRCQILISGKMRTFNRECKRREKKKQNMVLSSCTEGISIRRTALGVDGVLRRCAGLETSMVPLSALWVAASPPHQMTHLPTKAFLIIYSGNKKPESSNSYLLGPGDPCSLNVTPYQFSFSN